MKDHDSHEDEACVTALPGETADDAAKYIARNPLAGRDLSYDIYMKFQFVKTGKKAQSDLREILKNGKEGWPIV